MKRKKFNKQKNKNWRAYRDVTNLDHALDKRIVLDNYRDERGKT